MIEELNKCTICPWECKINRNDKRIGKCRGTNNAKIALVSLHFFEEPCITGKNGSGTVFFSNCNLKCKFCQNYEISQYGKGKEITIEELADIFIEQQKRGAENINLVTPTSYAYQIIEAIKIAKKNGLKLPIIYNTNAYENVETIKALEGYIDIYLPDFKYMDKKIAKQYSGVEDYPEVAKKAIVEMQKQVGNAQIDSKGIIRKGLIIRHLILPNNTENSKQVLKWINDNLPKETYVSIMAQYFPTYKAKDIEKINRKLTKKEYQEIMEYVDSIGLDNGYVQELGEHEEKYVPKWNI